jgi:biopolymer transport protein ExbD
MARPKIPRKSTIVDMTAMCDVAFLLLSFFILTAQFKPSEAVNVSTPSSVAAKIAPQKNFVMISLTPDNKVFLSTADSKDDMAKKADIIRSVNKTRNLGLTDAEIAALVKDPFIGVPLSQLKQQARMPIDQQTDKTLPGIPAKDSTNNELIDWMRGVQDAYQNERPPILLLKGDNLAKYPAFRNIIDAYRKNDFFHFQMVTSPESVPKGTDLFKESSTGKRQEEE